MLINKRNAFFSLFFICFAFSLFSQNEFDVKNIPTELLDKADAVVRLDETVFSIEDIGHAKREKRLVVTIFNERGEDKHLRFQEGYDKLNKLKKIEGIKYDAKGNVVERLKPNDIRDIGVSSFGTDILDARVKIASFEEKQSIFPYTVEYSFEIQTENMMFYPTFYPLEQEFTSIEKASLAIQTPPNFSIRYKELNGILPVERKTANGRDYYNWKVEHMPAFEKEPYGPTLDKPFVITAPTEFEVEGYRGNISTWKDVGAFYYELNVGRDVLPDAVKAKVKAITQDEKDVRVKIEKLYEFLQSGTHYMNISLGIGGWQTMKAEEVAKRGYGDCKALSNYMKALLHEAGIPACQALVYAGNTSSYGYPDFASMHFNHVITCVPLEKDTIFLECTSQTTALGYQGSFTGNRKALLILPGDGKLINTVVYKPEDNAQLRTGKIMIREDGSADASIKTTYTGIQQEKRNGVMNALNAQEQRDWMVAHIYIPSFDLINFTFSEKRKRIPELEENLKLSVKKAVTKSGTRLFLIPNLMTRFITDIALADEERKSGLFLNINRFNFHDVDTLVYELPKNYVPEFLPPPTEVVSKFGTYTSKITINENVLTYYRCITMMGGTFPKTDFKEWMDFCKKINKSDRVNVVFKLKE